MATVYLAHDLRHDRKVALKVLRPELAAVIGAERFLAEIKTTANLQHPHILPLFDSGEADGLVFYVMPFVEGEIAPRPAQPREAAPGRRRGPDRPRGGRRARLRPPPRRDPPRHQAGEHPAARRPGAGGRLRHRARGQQGRRHPDDRDRDVARHAALHEPRAGDGRAGDHAPRRDVYALGCVLYEMLTGEPPFTGPTAQAIVARVLTEEPRSLTLQRHTDPAARRGGGAHGAGEAAGRPVRDGGGVRRGAEPARRDAPRDDGRAPRSPARGDRAVARGALALGAVGVAVVALGARRRGAGSRPQSAPAARHAGSTSRFGDSVVLTTAVPGAGAVAGRLQRSSFKDDAPERPPLDQAAGRAARRADHRAPSGGQPRCSRPTASGWRSSPTGTSRRCRSPAGRGVTLADSVAGGFGGAAWLDDGTLVYVGPTLSELRG